VIEQGKIGLISLESRRAPHLIEERRDHALQGAQEDRRGQAREATANLLRLDDIISEIERNLRSLAPGRRARRFRKRRAELQRCSARPRRAAGRGSRRDSRRSAAPRRAQARRPPSPPA
jgi:chromosome segregation ATPase